MRHRWLAAGLGCALVFALAACSRPEGVDGALADDWPSLSEPKFAAPAAGVCLAGTVSNAFRVGDAELATAECTASHAVEVGHVGTLTGADANGSSVPSPDSAAGKSAYSACYNGVKEYLGDVWQNGRLHMSVHFPSDKAWDAGARFYRCDLVEVSNEDGKIVARTASLKDAMRGPKPAALTCVNDFGKDEDSVDGIDFVACAVKHTAEFVGVFTVTPVRAYPANDALRQLILDGCEGLAGKYLGVSANNVPSGLGWFSLGTTEDDWGQGNQSVRCYVGVFDRARPIRAGATLRGLGSKPIPR